MKNKEQAVQLKWLQPKRDSDLQIPLYHSDLAAGMDVRAALAQPITLAPGARQIVPSGFAVALPPGFELQVRPRSGLAIKHGLTVINAPGTIDADYRGEVKIALVNLGQQDYTINRGDRIAQLVLAPVWRAVLTEVDELPGTSRQGGGFGHTGLQ